MITPTEDNIRSFFNGMIHAIAIADGNKRGNYSAQVSAMQKELTTLEMSYECYCGNAASEQDFFGEIICTSCERTENVGL